ncbi:MAG: hypothetical protein KDD82_20455 [Planctomycetes bacterium]|nr:hypothetical protein [Planctomycetota bacterium]
MKLEDPESPFDRVGSDASVAGYRPWSQPPLRQARRCLTAGCKHATRHEKPFCSKHVLLHPYALRVASRARLQPAALRRA